MTTDEIRQALQHYRARLREILAPDELALYDAYRERIQSEIMRGSATPVAMTPEEQAVVSKIAADSQAAALNKQFFVLIGVEHLPQ